MADPKRSEAALKGWQTRRANEQAITNKVVELFANASAAEKSRSNFLSQFPGMLHSSPKHNHFYDFGYPAHGSLTFETFYNMYRRNGLAHGAVHMTVDKTWETHPQLLETPADKDETPQEKAVAERLRKIRFWQNMIEADRRSMVGAYSALILRIADNKLFNEPVDGKVPGGVEALKEVIPAWEGQLKVSEFDNDERSETYGQPLMYQFNEANVAGTHNKTRSFNVHPDRVLILSESGTVHDRSPLEPGYNALLDCEKISGAGGEGFWKNAKAAPVLKIDKDVRVSEMAKAMDVKQADLFEAISDQVDDYNTGIDKSLMLQGIEVAAHNVSLPSPEYFFNTALQIFCASMAMPMKVLIGMQTGERASTEDQNQWAKTNMARREMRVVPLLDTFLERLKQFGMIKNHDWSVHWDSLMEDSPAEMIAFAKQMADINQTMSASQPPFTHDEIRERVGYDPLKASDMIDPDEDEDYADPPKEDEDA